MHFKWQKRHLKRAQHYIFVRSKARSTLFANYKRVLEVCGGKAEANLRDVWSRKTGVLKRGFSAGFIGALLPFSRIALWNRTNYASLHLPQAALQRNCPFLPFGTLRQGKVQAIRWIRLNSALAFVRIKINSKSNRSSACGRGYKVAVLLFRHYCILQ